MPNTIRMRVCSGNGPTTTRHLTTDKSGIGMAVVDGEVQLFCPDHSERYDQALRELATSMLEAQPLEM